MADEGADRGAGAGPVWAMGLMSGTSMDGVDAALLLTDGVGIERFGPARALSPAYAPWDRALLREAAAALALAADGGPAPDQDLVARAGRAADEIHLAAAIGLRAAAEAPPALVGYHGQTLLHRPDLGATHQIGSGAVLAAALGVPVVSDFRSADMAAGGEGAPLAPFYHWALARHIAADRPVAFLNIGGVANVTWVDPAAEAPDAPGALVAFDTGPGNALIDDFVRERTGAPHDAGGAIAARGRVHRDRLGSNAAAAFLARKGPKSLDRDAFQGLRRAVEPLSTEDGAATLSAFTAACVAAARDHLPGTPSRWLVAGGGRHNATLMAMLGEALGAPVDPVEAVGLDGDMLEAQAFAYLAVRVARGLATSAPGTTGVRAPLSGGRIDRP